jgi:hypothetical protein
MTSRRRPRRDYYTSAPVSARRLWTFVCALGVAVAIGACGQVSDPPSTINNGVYVIAGSITYQLEVSRELNPYSIEDRQYLVGLPSGETPTGLTANQLWYGVFLWAKNQTQKTSSTGSVDIVDSSGNHYYPIQLNPQINAYAWTKQVLEPGAIEPAPGSVASDGPTQGGLLLFKLPTSVYSNRPLTLNIYPGNGGKSAQIALDL